MPNPIHVAMIQRLNQRFFLHELESEIAPELDPFGPLSDALGRLGAEVPDELREFVDAVPSAIAASLISVAAVATSLSIPLTFGWIASSDYELTVAQADRGEGSLITVVMRGPTPSTIKSSAD